jgi:hypothetical protein
MQETYQTKDQETPEFSTSDNIGFQRCVLPDQILRRGRQLNSRAAQFLELSGVSARDAVSFRDRLQRDESIVFTVRLCLLLLFAGLSVFSDESIDVGSLLVNLVAQMFDLLAVILNSVLLITSQFDTSWIRPRGLTLV